MRTVLRRLEQKGFVTHEINGRTFIYRAAENRQNVAVRAVKSIIDRFCGGSAEELVVGLVNSDVLDRRQFERLARKVAEGKIGDQPGAASDGRPAKKGEKRIDTLGNSFEHGFSGDDRKRRGALAGSRHLCRGCVSN